jgi:HK97 family phage portal protein
MARLLDWFFPTQTRGVEDVTSLTLGMGPNPAGLAHSFPAFVEGGYKGSTPIYSLVAIRAKAFSEATFLVRNLDTGEKKRPPNLTPLDRPWPNGTTGDLLAAMEVDVSLAGNAYIRKLPGGDEPTIGLQRLRPDWVWVAKSYDKRTGTVEVLGYAYYPGGRYSGADPIALDRDDVAHYIDMPDPTRDFMGHSWIQSAVTDVDADADMVKHKAKFFTHAGTPNLAVTSKNKWNKEQKDYLKSMFALNYEGVENAYKTVFMDSGADVRVIGSTMEQMSFSTVQASGEVRLAAAAGVPPVVVGFLSGIQAATYSNYSQAMRRYADLSIRPMWRNAAGALEHLIDMPDGFELWYDDRTIPFLQQDALDEAAIMAKNAATLASLHRAGYEMLSAKQYVATGNVDVLVHSGIPSVQVQTVLDSQNKQPDEGEDDE